MLKRLKEFYKSDKTSANITIACIMASIVYYFGYLHGVETNLKLMKNIED